MSVTPNSMVDSRYIARVNIYGAGITGLSAAHELVERGFKVRVIEPDVAMNRAGEDAPAIGGLARNQFVKAPKLLSPRWWEINEEASWTATAPRQESAMPVHFDNQSSTVSDESKLNVQKAVAAIRQKYGAVEIELISHSPAIAKDKKSKSLHTQRANAVKELFANEMPNLMYTHVHVQTSDAGAESTMADTSEETEADADVIDVRVVKTILPGEHGFHFFPRSYRHLFDLMRRTPILSMDGSETGRVVYDNLSDASHQGFATQFPQASGIDPTLDLLQFTMRIRRYLSSCPARRAAECEDISWLQFVTGWHPTTNMPLYVYSPAFIQGLKFSGRVLAAFDGEWGDARTNANTFVQLEIDSWIGGDKFDGILDGGETDRWFLPWRNYLQTAGVEFVCGRLESFEAVDGKVRALVVLGDQNENVPDQDADYFICATDVVTAEKVTSTLPQLGVAGSLRGYTTTVQAFPPSHPAGGVKQLTELIVRDPCKQPGLREWDRLQTLSGIQYFFANTFKLIDGYMYFTDAPWALSSINPQQFWTHQPTLEKDGYISILSVDIGDWNAPSKTPELLGKTAWQCTKEEIAEEVWRQITASLVRQKPHLILPQPVWYNLDQNIVFGDLPPKLPLENRTPYQIPTVGDWKNRPIGDPWNPTPTSINLNSPLPASLLPEGAVWQAKHGGYLLHWDKLVFAGTYMRTFTRMTTMESANESARHAVNAILDHLTNVRFAEQINSRILPPTQQTPIDEGDLSSNFTRDFARPSPVGDYCRIWDPEDHELASMKSARDEDAIRFKLGLPHAWDSLGVELPLSSVSYQRAAVHGWWPPKPSKSEIAAHAATAAANLPSTEQLREWLANIRERMGANAQTPDTPSHFSSEFESAESTFSWTASG